MSTYYPAVRAQTDFACAVMAFIRKLLQAVLPSLARDKSILGTEKQFNEQIDAALVALDHKAATELDYRIAVADTACGEVAKLCEILTDACECVGLADIAKRYLDPKRFIRLVLRQNTEKLETLAAIVKSGDRNLGRLLMRVSAALDGKPDTYDEMDAAAKRKATIDTKMIVAKVEEMRTAMDAHKDEIVSHVDAVGEKVDRLKLKGKRKSKYSDAQREASFAYWNAARKNTELKYASSKGVTHKTAFEHYRRELAARGVTSEKQFIAILNSIKSKACDARRKQLEAKREAERKAKRKPKPRSGR